MGCRGLAHPTRFLRLTYREPDAPPVAFHGWAAMLVGSGGLAHPTRFLRLTYREPDAPPVAFHGWAAIPVGSRDFPNVKLCLLRLVDQNWAWFAASIMSEAGGWPTRRVSSDLLTANRMPHPWLFTGGPRCP